MNCTEPEYAQALLQVYRGPTVLDHRGDASVLNAPSLRRAALVPTKARESEQRNLLAIDSLNQTEQRIYQTLGIAKPRPMGEIVESTGLNSSEVLATLFALERKGIIRQLPGKRFARLSL